MSVGQVISPCLTAVVLRASPGLLTPTIISLRSLKLLGCGSRLKCSTATVLSPCAKTSDLRGVMRLLPQPVVVVASAAEDPVHGIIRKGVTCSSFTSVSLEPSTVSVSIYSGNPINKVIERSSHFSANILSDNQVKFAMHFSKRINTDLCFDPFQEVDYFSGIKELPLLSGCLGSLQCYVTKMDIVRDHHVWYGEVIEAHASESTARNPMLYYQRRFRSIGDEIFMQAFEETSLPFEEWTHEAHLRLAWNYITQEESLEVAGEMIKDGILKFNEKHMNKITRGYHETVTRFFIHIIGKAVASMPEGHTFEDFLSCHSYLTDIKHLHQFYSPDLLVQEEAKLRFVKPDRMPLP